MNISDVLSQRLINQKLSSPNFTKPVEVVRWLGAVQAQDYGAAKWALGLRMGVATDAVVEEAFNKGKILRTHVMRPTWHFVAPEDISWLLQLTAPRVNVKAGPNYRKLELDAAVFKRTNKILTSALKGGKHLTRAELQKLLNNGRVDANDPIRLAHIFLRAELDAVVCSGPRIGKQFTYALFDERVPQSNTLSRDEALAKLALRYFTSHGPATLQDFVWWSGLTVADAQHGIDLAGRRLEKVNEYWTSPSERNTDVSPQYSAYLLPAFDEYMVAYKNRQAFLTQPSMTAMGLLGPMILVNGKLAGTWDRTNEKRSVTIRIRLFNNVTKSQRSALTKAVDRYEEFLGTEVQPIYV
jgi:hypothetical protein